MHNMKITDLIPSFALTALALASVPLGIHGFGFSLFPECFYYHFFHANIWHLLGNLLALYSFRPRWKTVAVAYACSTAAVFIPFMAVGDCTCGMSALIYACLARRYAMFRISPVRLLLINFLFILVPAVNWRIHFTSFMLSYCTWTVWRRRNA